MVFMRWTEELSVHVKKIDEQHQNLIDIINRAHDTDLAKNKDEGNKILDELIEFTRIHFSTEENYFEKCHYPDAEKHIEEHARYIQKVLNYKSKYESGDFDVEEFFNFLKEWLEHHLKVMDAGYVENFRECGLK